MSTNNDAKCPPSAVIEVGPFNIDLSCKERIVISAAAPLKNKCRHAIFVVTEQRGRERTKVPPREQSTGRDVAANPENPPSFNRSRGRSAGPAIPRNPITGFGLCGDGYGEMKPRKPKCFKGEDGRNQEPWSRCRDRSSKSATRRNPITGFGLCGDGVAFKPKKERPCQARF